MAFPILACQGSTLYSFSTSSPQRLITFAAILPIDGSSKRVPLGKEAPTRAAPLDSSTLSKSTSEMRQLTLVSFGLARGS